MSRTRRLQIAGRALGIGAAVALLGGCFPAWGPSRTPVGAPSATSTLVDCSQAGNVVVLTADAHLDPSCTYTRTIQIRASDVTLDCRGAQITRGAGINDSRGILVAAPANQALHDVTVRNCRVSGFLNNIRVTREGFKTLAAGAEYDDAYSDILIEHSTLTGSTGSGIFVDGYVTGVTMRNLHVQGSGSVGIYLEAGSKDNVIERSRILKNGFGDIVPGGVPFDFGGVEIRYVSTGREGIAVDGSRDNVIRDNFIAQNAAGGIFLYKNCGENATSSPAQHWTRRYPSSGNLIEANTIAEERNGVWIASRAAENQYFMDCSDAAYESGYLLARYRDPAPDNTVAANRFLSVGNAVRVEDDDNVVEDNFFASSDPAATAVLVGSKSRTISLGEPVLRTVVTDNRAIMSGNPEPYGWIWGHDATTFSGNTVNDAPATLAPGTQPQLDPFLFVRSFL